MPGTQIRLKTISQFRQESARFTIDVYQRGFRWTQTEVRDLLNDIREFSLSHPAESAFYCLQPIAVAPAEDGSAWKVIDGQQRLTTLFLFYCCYFWLAPPGERYNLLPFSLSYVGKPRLQACLNALTETEYVSARRIAAGMAEYENDIDCHYLLQAYQCIGDWLQFILRSSHTREGLRTLKETFDTRVKLIWQEVPGRDAASEAALFAKLNTGKIPLTNAELVKALLLERRNDNGECAFHSSDRIALRSRIAAQWDEMEAAFREPRFLSFLTGGQAAAPAFGRNVSAASDGLDLLLQVIALDLNRSVLTDAEKEYPDESPWTVPEAANGERFSFYVISNYLRLLQRRNRDGRLRGTGPTEVIWERIREVHRMFRNWYENPFRYHRIGFLLLTSPRPLPELLLELGRCDGHRLDEMLPRMIADEVFGTEAYSAVTCREWITGLTYPKDAQKIRQVLLLYNLAYLEAGDKDARFPFEQYRNPQLNWDLEHINAVADSMPEDDRRDTEHNARRQWLEKASGLPELGQIVTADGRQAQELIPVLLRRKTYLAGRQPGTPDFTQVYEAVIRFFDDSGEPDHSIGNLTLLDGGLNRAYRNDVFPLKRNAVLEHSIRGTFIPLCTRKVFMKGFRDSVDLLRWRDQDKRAYTEEIICFLCSWLKLEKEPHDADEGLRYLREQDIVEVGEQPAGETPMPYVTLRTDAALSAESGYLPDEKAPVRRPARAGAASAAATEESLWSLLSKHGFAIQIPLLQRGYVHGRPDAQAGNIRHALLDDIFCSLRTATAPGEGITGLDLGFVYGNVEENRRFVPVDGQQRLTTLFLLHWLLAFASDRLDSDPEVQNALLRFRYESREISSRLCRQLVLQPPARMKDCPATAALSEQIRACGWFQEEDDRDPGVRGMLVMLDAMQERTLALAEEGISAGQLFALLTGEKPPIRFLYLNLDDAGLTDSIYIRMNARGRPLTFYESFKVELGAFLRRGFSEPDEGAPAFADRFLQKLNGPWTEFFWLPEYRPLEAQPTTDVPTLRFFRFVILMEVLTNADPTGQPEIRSAVEELMREPEELFFSRLFRDGFRNAAGLHSGEPPVTVRTFRKVEKLLDTLVLRQREAGTVAFLNRRSRGNLFLKEEQVFRRLIGASEERAPDCREMVLLYAEYAFLIRHAHGDGSFHYGGALYRWLRLASNLTDAVWDLQADDLFRLIRAIHHLVESNFALHCEKALLRRPHLPKALSAFPASQITEEALKVTLMHCDGRWKRTIHTAEAAFPGGRIDMLFDFAGVGAGDSSEYEAFVRYLKRFCLLFNRAGVRPELEKDALLRRALLCYGGEDSYLLPPGKARRCFLDNTDRDFGFRRLLRDGNDGRRTVLKQLLDDLDESRPAVLQLREIIRHKTFEGTERWKEYFVTMPEILSSVRSAAADSADPMGEWVFQTGQRFIRRNSADDILLLSRTQTSSVNREYYSYALFLKARQRGLPVNYHADYTDSAEKYAWYENQKEGQVQILYRDPDGAGWNYVARRASDLQLVCRGTMEEMLGYISGTAFL